MQPERPLQAPGARCARFLPVVAASGAAEKGCRAVSRFRCVAMPVVSSVVEVPLEWVEGRALRLACPHRVWGAHSWTGVLVPPRGDCHTAGLAELVRWCPSELTGTASSPVGGCVSPRSPQKSPVGCKPPAGRAVAPLTRGAGGSRLRPGPDAATPPRSQREAAPGSRQRDRHHRRARVPHLPGESLWAPPALGGARGRPGRAAPGQACSRALPRSW